MTTYVCGTLDTKGAELCYMRDIIKGEGVDVKIVDLSTSETTSTDADVSNQTIAACHPDGKNAVFTGDRGTAVAGMTTAFEAWMKDQSDVDGVIGAGGTGGTALVSPAFRSLAVGIPKVLISTVASGNVQQYVGPADMLMMHSVADVQGINSITREVLANGANALAGMVTGRAKRPVVEDDKPAVGLMMFGVTTPCIQRITADLEKDHDCLVFHATGVGGRSMEKLLDSGLLSAVIDITTTEVCDLIAGGVFAANDDRFGASIRSSLPYIGSCGALDMVNFAAPETVPEKYRGRTLYEHNPQITLMRTTPEENQAMGKWIGEKLNQMTGPVRFFLPEGGVSLLDAPDMAFYDPEANEALFTTLEETVNQTDERQLIRVSNNINDDEFADLIIKTFRDFSDKNLYS